MRLKSDAKFEEKLWMGNIKNLANFFQSTQTSQNLDFDGIFLSKVENAGAYDNEVCCKIWRGIDLLFHIGKRNLTNVDPNSRKSQKFVLYCALFEQSI